MILFICLLFYKVIIYVSATADIKKNIYNKATGIYEKKNKKIPVIYVEEKSTNDIPTNCSKVLKKIDKYKPIQPDGESFKNTTKSSTCNHIYKANIHKKRFRVEIVPNTLSTNSKKSNRATGEGCRTLLKMIQVNYNNTRRKVRNSTKYYIVNTKLICRSKDHFIDKKSLINTLWQFSKDLNFSFNSILRLFFAHKTNAIYSDRCKYIMNNFKIYTETVRCLCYDGTKKNIIFDIFYNWHCISYRFAEEADKRLQKEQNIIKFYINILKRREDTIRIHIKRLFSKDSETNIGCSDYNQKKWEVKEFIKNYKSNICCQNLQIILPEIHYIWKIFKDYEHSNPFQKFYRIDVLLKIIFLRYKSQEYIIKNIILNGKVYDLYKNRKYIKTLHSFRTILCIVHSLISVDGTYAILLEFIRNFLFLSRNILCHEIAILLSNSLNLLNENSLEAINKHIAIKTYKKRKERSVKFTRLSPIELYVTVKLILHDKRQAWLSKITAMLHKKITENDCLYKTHVKFLKRDEWQATCLNANNHIYSILVLAELEQYNSIVKYFKTLVGKYYEHSG